MVNSHICVRSSQGPQHSEEPRGYCTYAPPAVLVKSDQVFQKKKAMRNLDGVSKESINGGGVCTPRGMTSDIYSLLLSNQATVKMMLLNGPQQPPG